MTHRNYIDFLYIIEKLKCNTRHSWTSSGRQESVAEHSWRLSVMAMLCADEYPEIDINKVIKMCLVHDFGEAVTGDIPAFEKTEKDEAEKEKAVQSILSMLPDGYKNELSELFAEMWELKTDEAKLFKALDNLEAVLSHNEADISTWLPREYEENLTYGTQNCEWSQWTKRLREELKKDSQRKIGEKNNLYTYIRLSNIVDMRIKSDFITMIPSYMKELDENAGIENNPELATKWGNSIINLQGGQDRYLELCYDGDRIIGFIYGKIDSEKHKGYIRPGWGYVMELYVLPEYRRKGVARSLYSRLDSYFAANGVKEQYLTADAVTGVPFWESIGFVRTDVKMPDNGMDIFEKRQNL